MLDSKSNEISESKFVFQRGVSDCGVACLMSVMQIFGIICHYETLLRISNCGFRGTNIIGLQNAANFYNFKVEAFRFENLNDLKINATFPCILLTKKYFILNHYIICCEKPVNNSTLMFDPSKGFILWERDHFIKLWKLNIAIVVVSQISM
jgi:ATP-binding cassette subfamily B protein